MFKTIFQNAGIGIMIMDSSGVIIEANQKACEIHGYNTDELIGLNIDNIEAGKNKKIFKERLERLLKGEAMLFETEHYRKDGTEISLEVNSNAIKIDGRLLIQSFQQDITNRKKVMAQILYSQKMESIGKLIDGIVHEFKNNLTIIQSFADVILQDKTLAPDTFSCISIIEKTAQKASKTVSQLISLARKDDFEPVPFNINTVIEDTLAMASKFMGRDIIIKRELKEPLSYIVGDTSQIEQMLINLIINAKEAMPYGGEIAIKTNTIDIHDTSLNIPAVIRSGEYVHLTVSDTGKGIAKEHLPHIFEPFYTTKEGKEGTGVGLPIAYSIVKEHSGYITVDSKFGHGTTFNIYLPVSKKKTEIVGTEEIVQFKGPETILVVDDEIFIMELLREVFLENGFNVILYISPLKCLDFFRSKKQAIDVVITDILMPEMDGIQLIKSLREISPDIKVIAMTGSDTDISDISIDGYLKKPFRVSDMLSMVKEVVNRGYNVSSC
jgi:PAS domain S-box-containing protein